MLFNEFSKSFLEHLVYTVAGQCSTCYGIHIVRVAGRSVFLHAQLDALYAILVYLLALELLLPLQVVLDLGSQSGCLALVVEVYAIYGVVVGIHGDETRDTAPKTHTLDGVDGLLLAVDLALVVLHAVLLLLSRHLHAVYQCHPFR
mgnify:CR=1 FL=1